MVLPAKPGLREWWKKCREVEGLTELHLEWVGEELKEVVRGSEVGAGIHSKYGLEVAGVDTETGAKGEGQRGRARGGEGGGGQGEAKPEAKRRLKLR